MTDAGVYVSGPGQRPAPPPFRPPIRAANDPERWAAAELFDLLTRHLSYHADPSEVRPRLVEVIDRVEVRAGRPVIRWLDRIDALHRAAADLASLQVFGRGCQPVHLVGVGRGGAG